MKKVKIFTALIMVVALLITPMMVAATAERGTVWDQWTDIVLDECEQVWFELLYFTTYDANGNEVDSGEVLWNIETYEIFRAPEEGMVSAFSTNPGTPINIPGNSSMHFRPRDEVRGWSVPSGWTLAFAGLTGRSLQLRAEWHNNTNVVAPGPIIHTRTHAAQGHIGANPSTTAGFFSISLRNLEGSFTTLHRLEVSVQQNQAIGVSWAQTRVWAWL